MTPARLANACSANGNCATWPKVRFSTAERKRALKAKADYLMRMNTALEVSGRFEYDDVVDPAETRDFLAKTLRALPRPASRSGRKRTVDTW